VWVKGFRIVLSKLTAAEFLMGALTVSLLLLLSCSEEEKHEALTFFFDGVPPLGGWQTQGVADPNGIADPNTPSEVFWYQHESALGCEGCHGDRKKRGFSRQVNLLAPVPDLCYQCHEQYMDLPGHLHGPVAVGVCTYCHEPHRTRHKYLLRSAIPELCYQCHDPEEIAFFDSNHADKSYENCNRCHEGHASENRSLLKKDWQETVSNSD
jgi:predicted CXXCH cytochrome family protein